MSISISWSKNENSILFLERRETALSFGSKMEEELCEHGEIKARKHAEESTETKRQMCGFKYQSEVKPVPTEFASIVEGRVTSAAQKETQMAN